MALRRLPAERSLFSPGTALCGGGCCCCCCLHSVGAGVGFLSASLSRRSDAEISGMAWVLAVLGGVGLLLAFRSEGWLAVALLAPAALVGGGLIAVLPASVMEKGRARSILIATALRHAGWAFTGTCIGALAMYVAVLLLLGMH